MVGSLVKTVCPGRNQPRTFHKLTVACACPPKRRIIILKVKTLVHHLVECRCNLLVDRPLRVPFRRQHNQVVALKHSRILVFIGRHGIRHIAVQVFDRLFRLILCKHPKINIKHIRRSVNRRHGRSGGRCRRGT